MWTISTAPEILPKITLILASMMGPVALGIILVRPIRRMIQFYQLQSLILALLTLLIAFEREIDGKTRVLLILFALLIPGLLAYIIEPLLAQATVPVEMGWLQRLIHPLLRHLSHRYRKEAIESIRKALPVWLEHGLSSSRQIISTVVGLGLIAVAYILAFTLLQSDPERAPYLAVSLTLLMLGIYTMISRQDLVSQVIGLLVMDHGLFLAVVGVIALPSLIPTFIVSLFLYILITLVILIILLPELHQASQTIEVADQKELQG